MLKLNLGSGSTLLAGFVNVDIAPIPGVDVVWDLDKSPWPWEDESCGLIRAWDVFEHVGEPISFMTECHRLLMDGGRLELHVPHWQYENAWTDPTHRRACTEMTFDYWCPDTPLGSKHNAAYGGVAFLKEQCILDGYDLHFVLGKL